MNGRAAAAGDTDSRVSSGEGDAVGVDGNAHQEDVIEADVQSVLEEMATSFKSFSETVFAKSLYETPVFLSVGAFASLEGYPRAPPRLSFRMRKISPTNEYSRVAPCCF
jgi:hypothetical protein